MLRTPPPTPHPPPGQTQITVETPPPPWKLILDPRMNFIELGLYFQVTALSVIVLLKT